MEQVLLPTPEDHQDAAGVCNTCLQHYRAEALMGIGAGTSRRCTQCNRLLSRLNRARESHGDIDWPSLEPEERTKFMQENHLTEGNELVAKMRTHATQCKTNRRVVTTGVKGGYFTECQLKKKYSKTVVDAIMEKNPQIEHAAKGTLYYDDDQYIDDQEQESTESKRTSMTELKYTPKKQHAEKPVDDQPSAKRFKADRVAMGYLKKYTSKVGGSKLLLARALDNAQKPEYSAAIPDVIVQEAKAMLNKLNDFEMYLAQITEGVDTSATEDEIKKRDTEVKSLVESLKGVPRRLQQSVATAIELQPKKVT